MSGDPTGCWLGAGSFGGSPNWQEWPVLKKYVVTIYWSIMTLTSIGYGDLLPVTVLERAFVALYGVWSMGLVRSLHYHAAILSVGSSVLSACGSHGRRLCESCSGFCEVEVGHLQSVYGPAFSKTSLLSYTKRMDGRNLSQVEVLKSAA